MSAHPDVIADLDRLGLDYVEMDCDPALADTAQFCEAYGIALEESANAILVASKKPEGHHAVCVALAHTRLDVNGTVRRKLGVRKLSFAPADLTRELTGQEIGGVTIFGLPEGLPVWLDARILGCARIIVGAGSRSAKISLDPSQLVGLEGYEFVDDLAVDIPSTSPAKRPDPVLPDPTPRDRLWSLAASQGLFRGDLVEAGPDQLAHQRLGQWPVDGELQGARRRHGAPVGDPGHLPDDVAAVREVGAVVLEAVETGDGHAVHLEARHVVADALLGVGQQVAQRCSQCRQRVALGLRERRQVCTDRVVGTVHSPVLLRRRLASVGGGVDGACAVRLRA